MLWINALCRNSEIYVLANLWPITKEKILNLYVLTIILTFAHLITRKIQNKIFY